MKQVTKKRMRSIFLILVALSALVSASVLAFLVTSLHLFQNYTWPRYQSVSGIHDRIIFDDCRDDWLYGFSGDFVTPIIISALCLVLMLKVQGKAIRTLLILIACIWIVVEVGVFSFFQDMNNYLE